MAKTKCWYETPTTTKLQRLLLNNIREGDLKTSIPVAYAIALAADRLAEAVKDAFGPHKDVESCAMCKNALSDDWERWQGTKLCSTCLEKVKASYSGEAELRAEGEDSLRSEFIDKLAEEAVVAMRAQATTTHVPTQEGDGDRLLAIEKMLCHAGIVRQTEVGGGGSRWLTLTERLAVLVGQRDSLYAKVAELRKGHDNLHRQISELVADKESE